MKHTISNFARGLRLALALVLGAGLTGGVITQTSASGEPGGLPLAGYAGFGHDMARDEATFTDEELQREKMIAVCMEESGFTYVPSPSMVFGPGGKAPTEVQGESPAQRNDDYVRSLDDSKRAEYFKALAGTRDPEREYIQGAGCIGAAFTALPGVYAAAAQLREELEAIDLAVRSDQAVASAARNWKSCMAEKGHNFESPADLAGWLDRRAASAQPGATLATESAWHSAAMQEGEACEKKVGLDSAEDTVRVKLERELIDEHRELFEKHQEKYPT